jgi:outer membrane protein, heavy metal efflux system
MSVIPLIVGFALAAVPSTAVADPGSGRTDRLAEMTPPLTLAAALDEALARNPELIALQKQFEVARRRPVQERYLPAPTFEAQIWQWPVRSIDPRNTGGYMFSVGQMFPDRGARRLRGAVLEKDAELAASDVAVRARQIVDEVKRTYAGLFVARKAAAINSEHLALLRQFADVSEIRYATGRISQQDVLKAVVELSRLHDELAVIEERARLAEAQLNTLLDRPPHLPIGPLAEPRESVRLPPPEELQRLALERQPELTAARLEVERGEMELALARREFRPDVFVMGGYMIMPGMGDTWTANVGISWPNAPWSRGRLEARVAETEAGIAAAQARLRATENAVRLAVQEAWVRVKTAEQRAALLRTSIVPQSEQTLEVSRIAYQADRIDFLALIDNQRVLLDAELAYHQALSDLEQGLADLERAVGAEIPAMQVTDVDAPPTGRITTR